MHGYAVLLLAVLVLAPARFASAVFYNDSDVIEIGGGVPDTAPDEDADDPGTSEGSSEDASGASDAAGGAGGGSADDGGFTTDTGGAPAGGAGTAGGGSGDGEESAEDTAIQTLTASGALTGVEAGAQSGADAGAGGASGSGNAGGDAASAGDAGASGSSSSGGAAGSAFAGGGGSFSVHIDGAKVRAAAQSSLDLREVLRTWRSGRGQLGAKEYGLIAASTAVSDANLEEATFTASAFEIVYRSRGYLLAVIPWTFPVHVTVAPDASSLDERVRVKLPWYRFFVRMFFTAGGLQRDIDAALAQARAENTDSDAGTALLFDAVTQFLRRKVGTVENSVLLGTD